MTNEELTAAGYEQKTHIGADGEERTVWHAPHPGITPEECVAMAKGEMPMDRSLDELFSAFNWHDLYVDKLGEDGVHYCKFPVGDVEVPIVWTVGDGGIGTASIAVH